MSFLELTTKSDLHSSLRTNSFTALLRLLVLLVWYIISWLKHSSVLYVQRYRCENFKSRKTRLSLVTMGIRVIHYGQFNPATTDGKKWGTNRMPHATCLRLQWMLRGRCLASAHQISSFRKCFRHFWLLQAQKVLSVINTKAEHGDMLSFPYESGFLGAIAKSRKETITFVMSARLPVLPRGTNSAHAGRILIKFGIWAFFENLFRKFKFD